MMRLAVYFGLFDCVSADALAPMADSGLAANLRRRMAGRWKEGGTEKKRSEKIERSRRRRRMGGGGIEQKEYFALSSLRSLPDGRQPLGAPRRSTTNEALGS